MWDSKMAQGQKENGKECSLSVEWSHRTWSGRCVLRRELDPHVLAPNNYIAWACSLHACVCDNYKAIVSVMVSCYKYLLNQNH